MPTPKLPLLDADILAYETAFAGQFYDEEKEELQILPFHLVKDKIEQRVLDVMDTLDTRLEPIMYLTGEGNFREAIAKKKGYKANRKDVAKPYHLFNARAYITARFNTYISRGCEADDLLCISQTENNRKFVAKKTQVETVICTRDKDLRQCEGWHYGWEMGKQPEFPLQWVDVLGTLNAIYVEGVTKAGNPSRRFKELKGTGLKWLYAQVLTGDVTDNIPGLPRYGGGTAFKLLDPCNSEGELIDAVVGVYKEVYGDKWIEELYEQAHLVYMITDRNEDGSLKWWSLPEEYYGNEAGEE
ncbi:MAG: exonuclease [Planctomycetes bacterium]|nr:exonuclease [Planctomycetota bacterium]